MLTFNTVNDINDSKLGGKNAYFALVSDNWDDYTYKTLYTLYHIQPHVDKKFSQTLIGKIKILDVLNKATALSEVFNTLSPRYCSLGQDEDYYNNLEALGAIVARDVLTALRDAAYNRDIFLEHGNSDGFKLSLLRSSYAEKLLDRFPAPSRDPDLAETTQMSFDVSAQLFRSGNAAHRVRISLKPGLLGLHRIGAIIGRNGVGKTKLLNAITIGIAGINHPDNDALDIKITPRPKFSRVFASSFSAVDPNVFERLNIPKHCRLIRLSDEKTDQPGWINLTDAIAAINEAPSNRVALLTRYAKIAIGLDATQHSKDLVAEIIKNGRWKDDQDRFGQLSSGEYTLIGFIIKVLAYIVKNSLVILDEPETHLHPTYIVQFFRILSLICEEFDSYAIISTHSPLIVQSLPSSNVVIMQVRDGIPVTVKPRMETFGESVGVLIEEVFGTREERSYYSDVLSSPDCDTEHKLRSIFPNGVGMHAKTCWRQNIKPKDSSE